MTNRLKLYGLPRGANPTVTVVTPRSLPRHHRHHSAACASAQQAQAQQAQARHHHSAQQALTVCIGG